MELEEEGSIQSKENKMVTNPRPGKGIAHLENRRKDDLMIEVRGGRQTQG